MKYILTGRTGSGLSTAKRVFERNGFLISYPRLSKFNVQDYDDNRKYLIVIDVNTAIADGIKEDSLVQYYQEFYAELRKDATVICLDADESVLFRRQQEDYLPPLYSKYFNIPWMNAFKMEKKVLLPFYENASFTFNTSTSANIDLAQAIDLFINLELKRKIEASSYQEFLSSLYYEDFRTNIGSKMSIFREIFAEPDVVQNFLDKFDAKIRVPLENKDIQERIKKASRIVMTGMGSSYYSGQAVKELLQKCYKLSLPLDCIPLSEISFGDLKNVLVIISSNSGETGEIKECFKHNLFKDAVGIFGVTNYEESFLAKKCRENKANLLFTMDAPKEQSIPATISVTANLLIMSGILAMLQKTVDPTSQVVEAVLADIKGLPGILRALLSQGMLNQMFSWACKMAKHFHKGTGYVIGCGALTAILPEVALKGIELAKLHLCPQPHSFAHGPLNSGAMEVAIYMQDVLTSKEVVVKHMEKLVQHCPVFAIGPYWEINLPNLHNFACSSENPTTSIFSQLMVMQLVFSVLALLKGISATEICYPSMLQKVVLSSPISQ